MYAFPPNGFWDFGDAFWDWCAYVCMWFTCLQFAASLWHFERRWYVRPCPLWTVILWVVVAATDGAILWSVRVNSAPGRLAWFFCMLALPMGLLNGGQCAEARSRQRSSLDKPISRAGLLNGVGLYFVVCMALIFITTPGCVYPREASNRTQCRNNLKQLGVVFHDWNERQGRFPDSQIRDGDQPPRSWRVDLLRYLDLEPLHQRYDQSHAWDKSPNLRFASHRVHQYVCPTVPLLQQSNSSGHQYTAYALLLGAQTAFPDGKGLKFSEFKDGTSNTALIVEACGQQIVWSEPRDIEVTDTRIGINLPSDRKHHSPAILSSYHQGGAGLLLADGSARFISNNIDPTVLRALTTAASLEPTGEF